MRPLRIKIIVVCELLYSVATGILKGYMLFNEEVYEMTKALVQASMAENALLEVPFSLQIAFSMLGVVVIPVCAVLIWRGVKWGLYGLSLWIAASLTLTLLVAGPSVQLWAKFPLAILILALLYTGSSKRYLFERSAPKS